MEQIVLVQISDVHFGHNQIHSDFLPESNAPHDMNLCKALPRALRDVYRVTQLDPNESFYVIVSGDVTRQGLPREFDIARTYFHARWELAGGYSDERHVGLNLEPKLLYTVPGNHDHWNASYRWWWRILGSPNYNPTIFREFRATPWGLPIWSKKGGLVVEIYGIDSSSGRKERMWWQRNFRQSGYFTQEELASLNSCVGQVGRASLNRSGEARRVPIVVSHHGLSPKWHHRWNKDARQLTPDAQEALVHCCKQHDIKVILSGHTHDYFLGELQAGETRIREIRSPATLQGPATVLRQGFIVHQIQLCDGSKRVQWTPWLYLWNGYEFVTRPPCDTSSFTVG